MARRGAGGGGTESPDSGFKFKCQYCEGDISQLLMPELIFHLEKIKGETVSTGYQACILCVKEIQEDNAIFNRENKTQAKQTMSLRPMTALEDVLPSGALESVKASAATDAKLDKLADAVAALTQLMTLQMQSSIKTPVHPIALATPVVLEPKPKRKILAPPVVKASAKSKVADKPRQVRQAKAKQKPRSKK